MNTLPHSVLRKITWEGFSELFIDVFHSTNSARHRHICLNAESHSHSTLREQDSAIDYHLKEMGLGQARDGQMEDAAVLAESGRSDVLLRRMLPYLT